MIPNIDKSTKTFSGLNRNPRYISQWISEMKEDAIKSKINEIEAVYSFKSKMRGIAAQWVRNIEKIIPNSVNWNLNQWLKAMEIRFNPMNSRDSTTSATSTREYHLNSPKVKTIEANKGTGTGKCCQIKIYKEISFDDSKPILSYNKELALLNTSKSDSSLRGIKKPAFVQNLDKDESVLDTIIEAILKKEQIFGQNISQPGQDIARVNNGNDESLVSLKDLDSFIQLFIKNNDQMILLRSFFKVL
ncbi:hypothetical protein BB560_005920 [Smittium megazygosporum]|uniref:Uncharacterized protein n=1 Tax=Smittium megazygosporum TaxID=133381 RepID=A0A2T9YQU4_9FUNG|nr:hypothetical protein BB560_005920 [Smittium megazygosporum]